jgi:hypothetical protein
MQMDSMGLGWAPAFCLARQLPSDNEGVGPQSTL